MSRGETPPKTLPETCHKKRTFFSNRTAREATQRRNLIDNYKFTTKYKCNVCGYWHLTTRKVKQ
jgi:rubrerythrin